MAARLPDAPLLAAAVYDRAKLLFERLRKQAVELKRLASWVPQAALPAARAGLELLELSKDDEDAILELNQDVLELDNVVSNMEMECMLSDEHDQNNAGPDPTIHLARSF